MPSPTPPNISIDRDHSREQRLIQIEGGRVTQELLDEFSELAACDRKGKKKAEERRTSAGPSGLQNGITPEEQYILHGQVHSPESLVNPPLRERRQKHRPPRPSLSRMLLRRMESESARQMAKEEKEMEVGKEHLIRMAARAPASQMPTRSVIPPERVRLDNLHDLRDHRQRVRDDYEPRIYREEVNSVYGISGRSRPSPQPQPQPPRQTEAGPSRPRMVIQEQDRDGGHFHDRREGPRFQQTDPDEEDADIVEESMQWIRRRRRSLGQPDAGDQSSRANGHAGPQEEEYRPPRVRVQEQGDSSRRSSRRTKVRTEDKDDEDEGRGERS